MCNMYICQMLQIVENNVKIILELDLAFVVL